jgi:error-prone DNA polymerase
MGRWQRLIADYATSGVTIGDHAMAILRERIAAPKLATSAQLPRLPNGSDVSVAGLVIARQRPGTANGTMFLLFEDEFGTVNLIVPRLLYERRRHLARAEPLLLARGRLERHQEGASAPAWGVRDLEAPVREADGEVIRPVINLLVAELEPLERFLDGEAAEEVVRRLHPAAQPAGGEEQQGAEVGSTMRAVAPPIQSFAAGRRR